MRATLALLSFPAAVVLLPAQEPRPLKSAASDCAAVALFQLTDVAITKVAAVEPTAAQRATGRGPVCRVEGRIGTETHFVALLPDNWNRRFMMGGGGGFVGSVQNMAEESVNAGFATVGTDAGHKGNGITAGWAVNHPERVESWAYLAVHRSAEVAKQIIRTYYGRDPLKSYFFGCSNGGRQGLLEAQRYPDDFDGIVAVAPALHFTVEVTSFVRNLQSQYPTADFSRPLITAENLALLEKGVLDACDSHDGVLDGILDDPRDCSFRMASIPACPSDVAGAGCLTGAQRAAIERVYSPLRLGGRQLYPGQPFGNEAAPGAWLSWITGITPGALRATGNHAPSTQGAFGTESFKYLAFGDSLWDYTRYDLSNAERDLARVGALANATNPDLRAFTARGGKLILAHGWSDPALNALSTIAYYDEVRAKYATAAASVRLFLLPGVLHCSGGTGCDNVDWFAPIVDWVERGVAPERIVASKLAPAAPGTAPGMPRATVRTRPLCAYPLRARYIGTGSTDEAGSFSCK